MTIVCYRPGKLLRVADLISRAKIEQDPEAKRQMALEIVSWQAQQEIDTAEQNEENKKVIKRLKADDMVGESPLVTEVPPHRQSPAERAMQGDPCAYDEGKLEKHMQMLIRGASVDMEDIDTCESVVKKIQQITQDMENGTYEPDSDYEAEEEEDPKIIEMYELACSAVGWQMPATYTLPTKAEMQQAQADDEYVCKIKSAIQRHEEGAYQDAAEEEWPGASDNQANYAVHEGILINAWIKGKGRHSRLSVVWQTVAPKSLRPQIIQAYHTSLRNSHYGHGELKTFAQIRESDICPSAFGDVRKSVLQCEQCQRFGARPAKAARQWSIECSTPGEHWMVDVVHMPKPKSGNEWMLTMIDVCSRWAVARPVSNIQHQEMARVIMEEWAKVGVHIVPRKVAHS